VSEDQQVLSNGTTEYAYYRTVSRNELNRARLHSYDGDVEWGEEGNCSVYANSDRPDVVWVADYDDCYLFVTDGGRASMDAWFVERDIQNFCV
jgi:hypothetical protein